MTTCAVCEDSALKRRGARISKGASVQQLGVVTGLRRRLERDRLERPAVRLGTAMWRALGDNDEIARLHLPTWRTLRAAPWSFFRLPVISPAQFLLAYTAAITRHSKHTQASSRKAKRFFRVTSLAGQPKQGEKGRRTIRKAPPGQNATGGYVGPR